jgi:ubiquinol-cytochrome c reductase cytochrome c1 subunit
MNVRLCGLIAGLVLCTAAFGATEVGLMEANNNIANIASLQRGAKYFVNYCLGCHSAQYVRYNTLGEGLQLSDDQLVKNLMFTGERPFDTMENAMRPSDAERWFGIAPPDLSLIARSRGTDYIYTYLHSFYADPDSETGANNLVLPGTAMPYVLWRQQGIQAANFTEDENGAEMFQGFEMMQPGQMSSEEFDQMTRDIVNFLQYIGEPRQREREALGIRVIGFLLVFLLIAYLLKKEIWKDVE